MINWKQKLGNTERSVLRWSFNQDRAAQGLIFVVVES